MAKTKLKTKTKRAAPIDASGREKILNAAAPLFAEKGLDGTTTRDIAEASQLNVSLISYYFGGKEQLYKEILHQHFKNTEQTASMIFQEFNEQKMTKDVFQSFLKKLVSEILTNKVKNSDIERIIYREITSGLPHGREIFETIMDDVGANMVSIFIKAQDEGILRKDLNVHALLLHLVHSIEGYLNMQRCKTKWSRKVFSLGAEQDQLVEHILSIFLYGIFSSKKNIGAATL